MKKILLACLLGIGTLLPSSEVKSSIVSQINWIISITLEGTVLIASSGESDGPLKEIQIYDLSSGVMVASQQCGGNNSSMDISGLPKGKNYIAYVIAENSVATKKFKW